MTKKLIVFDMDGTLIKGNTWENFNTALGISKEQDLELYLAFAQDQITYDQWLTKLHLLYKLDENKHSKEQVLEYLTQYKLAANGAQVVTDVKSAGHNTLLLTGSFQMTADAVAFELGIDQAIALTKCIFNEDGYLERLESAGNERQAKVSVLVSYCQDRNISLADCVVIGDGGNMIELFNLVENSVAFETSGDEIRESAKYTIKDLSDLPPLVSQLS